MRTIEKNIIQALNGGNGVKSLSCRDRVEVDGDTKKYYLWNSLLFWNDEENIYFSFCGYPTKTTKSRLDAIFNYFNLGGFYQKNYVVYWVNNGSTKIEVDTDKKYKIVFLAEHAVKIEAVNE